MIDWTSHSDQLTPEEEQLGFRLREVVAPNSRFARHPRKMRAVVCDLSSHTTASSKCETGLRKLPPTSSSGLEPSIRAGPARIPTGCP